MRRIAEPDLERITRQRAHTVHERIVEHDVPKQLTLDGLRSDVPYAYHYCKAFHHVTVHITLPIIPLALCTVQSLIPDLAKALPLVTRFSDSISILKVSTIGTYDRLYTSLFVKDKPPHMRSCLPARILEKF